jgi:hypothetical protein
MAKYKSVRYPQGGWRDNNISRATLNDTYQESRVKSQESRVKSQESKVKSQKSRVKSQESRVKSQESKVKSQESKETVFDR